MDKAGAADDDAADGSRRARHGRRGRLPARARRPCTATRSASSASAWAACSRFSSPRSRATRSGRRCRTTASRWATARPTGRGSPRRCGATSPENDDFFPPDAVKALEAELKGMGKDVEFDVTPATGSRVHERRERRSARTTPTLAAECWTSTVAFLHEKLRLVPAQAPSARSIAGGISSRPSREQLRRVRC